MAYTFNGTNQYLSTASTPVTAVPLTLTGSFNRSTNTTNGTIVAIGRATNADGTFFISAAGATAGDPVTAVSWGSSVRTADSTTGFTTGTWFNGAGTFTTTIDRSAYIDGGSVGSSSVDSGAPASLASIYMGANRFLSGFANYLTGSVSEVAIWNVVLTAAELVSLAKGFKPYRIRPQSLVFYAPMIRDLIDPKGARAITNNNTATVSAHPRVY